MPPVAVIITTYNRWSILDRALDCLARQTVDPALFEVLVVDDGSTEAPPRAFTEWVKLYNFSCRFWRIPNGGQGQARNFALTQTTAEIICFIGDDILVEPTWLEQHLSVHNTYSADTTAVVGFTTWHPEVKPTAFMYFLEHGGHQFKYDALKKYPVVDERGWRSADFWFFYTSNISLKKTLLDRESFLADFSAYGWEDIELGYRLKTKEGLQLYYDPHAVAYHYHVIREEDLPEKMRTVGRTAVVFQAQYPEVPVLWRGYKKIIFQLISSRPMLLVWRGCSFCGYWGKYLYWYALTKKYFAEGVRESGKNGG